MQSKDGYGREWEYRIVSQLDTEPDAPENTCYLAIHEVHLHMRRDRSANLLIETDQATIDGATVEELIITLERMQQALDRPAAILAEHGGYGTTEHSCVFETPRVRTRFDYGGEFSIEVQLEKYHVHALQIETARQLCAQLQAALATAEGGESRAPAEE